MSRRWFHLVGPGGRAWTSVTSVFVEVEPVAGLRKAIKREHQGSYLAGIAASDLVVFRSRAAFDARQSREPQASIGMLGRSEHEDTDREGAATALVQSDTASADSDTPSDEPRAVSPGVCRINTVDCRLCPRYPAPLAVHGALGQLHRQGQNLLARGRSTSRVVCIGRVASSIHSRGLQSSQSINRCKWLCVPVSKISKW